MDKINIRSPYYLTTEDTPVTPPTPIAPQTIQLNCGDTHNTGLDVGNVTYEFNTTNTGDVDIVISGNDVPVKFTVEWDGNTQTTEYIGLDTFDAQLLAEGVPQSEIATGDPSTKNTTLTINKTAANPSLVKVNALAPLINDSYTLTVNCPAPPPVVIVQTTQINIWFDSSGSMNATLSPLLGMVQNNLKSCLVQFYNNDSAEYDKYVKVRNWPDERTISRVSFEPDVLGATNVINIIFQDEGQIIYHPSTSSFTGTQSSVYLTDIQNYYNIINANSGGYISALIFQVEFSSPAYTGFKGLMQAVENGTGLYAGTNGLFGQNNVKFYYDIQDGVSYSSDPDYYRDFIIQGINDLGFSITCP